MAESDKSFQASLDYSERLLIWVAESLDGLTLTGLGGNRRMQLASCCWHVAIEHGQAIVVLLRGEIHGSALALLRPLFESYVRGLWLMRAATDAQVERAGRDEFPKIGLMLSEIEALKGGIKPQLSKLKGDNWERLCSYTHTGMSQISARLTETGIGYDYPREDLHAALKWADGFSLTAFIEFAGLAGDTALAMVALNKMRARLEQGETTA